MAPVVTEPGRALAAGLRAATQQAHRALDHHPLLAPLVRTDLDLPRYGLALAALHAPQAALEAAVAPRLAQFGDGAAFPARAGALAADLSDLGLAPALLKTIPPQAEDDAGLVGLLYVLEGSRLGGALILRRLADSLPAQTPRRFFSVGDDPQRWARFWAWAERRVVSEAAVARAAQSSVAAFRLYREHLDACAQADASCGPGADRRNSAS